MVRQHDQDATAEVGGRKSKSAEVERSLGLSGWETPDDEPPRPVTAALPARATDMAANPPSRAGKKSGRATPTAAPTAAPMDGWGDFDTDRLLREEYAIAQEMEEAIRTPAVDMGDASLRRESRDNRLEALAKHTGKPPPPVREPSKQVLRQRTLAVMELAAPEGIPPDVIHSPVKSALKKSLVTNRRREMEPLDDSAKLPKIKRGLVSAVSPTPRAITGLFGPHIDDSIETRAVIFQRFLPVWSLMSSRGSDLATASTKVGEGAAAPTSQGSSSNSSTSVVARDCKSPFECSMVLTKICKTIGITLTASPPPEVWSSPRRRSSSTGTSLNALVGGGPSFADVDLDSFCEFVVRNALQPAMHHFRLDRDVGEYLHTIDAVVHGLVTRRETLEMGSMASPPLSQWRLRELNELQPVLPLWKKGIHFIQKQAPPVKAKATASGDPPSPEDQARVDTDALSSIQSRGGDVAVIQATDLSTRYNKKLPAHEARALQDANLRRKLQLRNSWQPRVVAADGLDKVADPPGSSPLVGSSILLVEAAAVPTQAATQVYSSSRPDNQAAEVSPRNDFGPPGRTDRTPAVLLLCGSCVDEQEATLWCSACFAVFCSACWTATHSSTVDMSCVTNQQELTLSAPSARPLFTQRGTLAPPVAMVYLPTKPISTGKLHKGPSSHPGTNQMDDPARESSDSEEETNDNDDHGLASAMSSHAILPAIKPPLPKVSALRKIGAGHRSAPTLDSTASVPLASAMDSTANLLKALMLGTASSASVLGSSSTEASPWSSSSDKRSTSTTAKAGVGTRRKKLHPSAITLDAATLLPH